jgi:anti-sigma factor RsiW
MSPQAFTDDELLAYLDEQLPVEQMTLVESALRASEPLRRHTAGLVRQRDQGGHTVGGIWRQLRLSCPPRKQLGAYLLDALDSAEADYLEFHLRTVGCRYCIANLSDLEQEMQAAPETQQRRSKFFQSSAGFLQRSD